LGEQSTRPLFPEREKEVGPIWPDFKNMNEI
jgi:hypothetical protein